MKTPSSHYVGSVSNPFRAMGVTQRRTTLQTQYVEFERGEANKGKGKAVLQQMSLLEASERIQIWDINNPRARAQQRQGAVSCSGETVSALSQCSHLHLSGFSLVLERYTTIGTIDLHLRGQKHCYLSRTNFTLASISHTSV